MITHMLTLGGRVRCIRCNATSKRTKLQCKAPAAKGKTKCRFHGGYSEGPTTPEGRQRCADAKTVHGRDTRRGRVERAQAMQRLRKLEQIGHAMGFMSGARIPGRKPSK